MKRSQAVKASVAMLAKQVVKLNAQVETYDAKYRKVKGLVEQALSHRYCLERAVKAIAEKDGTCWCGALHDGTLRDLSILHTSKCDALFLAVYGAERGE